MVHSWHSVPPRKTAKLPFRLALSQTREQPMSRWPSTCMGIGISVARAGGEAGIGGLPAGEALHRLLSALCGVRILLVSPQGLRYLADHIAGRANQGKRWGAKARVLVRPTSGNGLGEGGRGRPAQDSRTAEGMVVRLCHSGSGVEINIRDGSTSEWDYSVPDASLGQVGFEALPIGDAATMSPVLAVMANEERERCLLW